MKNLFYNSDFSLIFAFEEFFEDYATRKKNNAIDN